MSAPSRRLAGQSSRGSQLAHTNLLFRRIMINPCTAAGAQPSLPRPAHPVRLLPSSNTSPPSNGHISDESPRSHFPKSKSGHGRRKVCSRSHSDSGANASCWALFLYGVRGWLSLRNTHPRYAVPTIILPPAHVAPFPNTVPRHPSYPSLVDINPISELKLAFSGRRPLAIVIRNNGSPYPYIIPNSVANPAHPFPN